MSTALAVPSQHEMPWTQAQMQVLRAQIAPECTDEELAFFSMVCKRTDLDPFSRQIYAIKRRDKMSIQTGIDGYRLIAARSGALAGIDDPIYDSEEADHPNKATVTVYRFVQGQRVPFTATARWREYAADGGLWKKMPYLMLGKVCEALALRKAFPAELSGLYTAEEMDQADTSPADPVTQQQRTASQTVRPRPAPKPASKPASVVTVAVDEPNPDREYCLGWAVANAIDEDIIAAFMKQKQLDPHADGWIKFREALENGEKSGPLIEAFHRVMVRRMLQPRLITIEAAENYAHREKLSWADFRAILTANLDDMVAALTA